MRMGCADFTGFTDLTDCTMSAIGFPQAILTRIYAFEVEGYRQVLAARRFVHQ